MFNDLDSVCDPDNIKAKFPKYKKPYECSTHLKITLKEFTHLAILRRECLIEGELYDLINLEGTVAVAYKGNTYNIPLRVILREDYPATAPIIYVKPTENMILGKNVSYVNSRGKISLPYLENWEKENHPDLYKLFHVLCILFANNPPVWTKRTNSMVKVYESKSLKNKSKGGILTGLENPADTRTEQKQGQSGFTSLVTSSKERSLDTSREIRSPEIPAFTSEPPHSTSSSEADSASLLSMTDPKDLLDDIRDNKKYKSAAYAEPQSSKGSSDESPSPEPVGGVFAQTAVGRTISSPGNFVSDLNRDNNNRNKYGNNGLERQQPQPNTEAHFSRSYSEPSNLFHQKPYNVLTTYKRRGVIGSGGFAKVYFYENEKNGHKVACKVVDLGANDEHVQKCSKALKKEIKILSTLSHDFIINYLSTEEHNNHLAMIMEYFPKGSLYSELQRRVDRCFDEPTTRVFTWQIIQGVKYLHKNAIIHKDIKARNILIDDSNVIKIADFGISKKMDELITVTTASKDNFASIYWQSPEYLRGEKYGRKTDIWSIGCTVVEMLVGEPPLLCDKITREAAGMRILQGCVYPPKKCSEVAKEFLEYCFRLERDRPTAKELMEKTEFPSLST